MDPQLRSERFGGKRKLLAQSGMERRFLILPSLGLNTLSSILAPRVLIMVINFSSEQCLCSDGQKPGGAQSSHRTPHQVVQTLNGLCSILLYNTLNFKRELLKIKSLKTLELPNQNTLKTSKGAKFILRMCTQGKCSMQSSVLLI